MSPREALQEKLISILEVNKDIFSAPWGVLDGLETLPRGGKVRTITFGVARTLDACAYIWTDRRVTVEARGPLEYKFRNVNTPQGFIDALNSILPKNREIPVDFI